MEFNGCITVCTHLRFTHALTARAMTRLSFPQLRPSQKRHSPTPLTLPIAPLPHHTAPYLIPLTRSGQPWSPPDISHDTVLCHHHISYRLPNAAVRVCHPPLTPPMPPTPLPKPSLTLISLLAHTLLPHSPPQLLHALPITTALLSPTQPLLLNCCPFHGHHGKPQPLLTPRQ